LPDRPVSKEPNDVTPRGFDSSRGSYPNGAASAGGCTGIGRSYRDRGDYAGIALLDKPSRGRASSLVLAEGNRQRQCHRTCSRSGHVPSMRRWSNRTTTSLCSVRCCGTSLRNSLPFARGQRSVRCLMSRSYFDERPAIIVPGGIAIVVIVAGRH
jgi:hypothetical protein